MNDEGQRCQPSPLWGLGFGPFQGPSGKTTPSGRGRCATAKASAQRGESPRQVWVNRPVAESNCGGESRPWRATGSELPVRNKEARMGLKMNSILLGATGERATKTRSPELKPKLSQERSLETAAATANEPELKKNGQ